MELWQHQIVGVEKARTERNVALFYEAGTGKTATAIRILREEYTHHKKIIPTLIFAPISVCPQWKTEFAKFSKISEDSILVLTGSGKKRVEELQRARKLGKPVIVITNYEAVQIDVFYQELLSWSPKIFIGDEIHRCKDSTSVRAKKIYPLAKACDRRFILTGTPILNSMLDIFGQYKLLDERVFGPNFWAFKNKYFYDKNAGMPSHCHFPDWQPRPESAEEIGRAIARLSVQAKKEDCLDLPPLTKIVTPVELSSEQRRVYEDLKKYFVAEIKDGFVSADFAMTKIMRMQQVMAGFTQPDNSEAVLRFKDNPRLSALADILDSIGTEKAIVWSIFKATYKDIAAVCEKLKLKYAFLTGEQSAAEKQISLNNFKFGDVQVLISNPQAGGVGLNMAEAKYAVYYTRSYSLEQYLQSEARNYRGGSEQHDRVTHYHLVSKDTLDEVIMDALLNKQNVAEKVLDSARKSLTEAEHMDIPSVTRRIIK